MKDGDSDCDDDSENGSNDGDSDTEGVSDASGTGDDDCDGREPREGDADTELVRDGVIEADCFEGVRVADRLRDGVALMGVREYERDEVKERDGDRESGELVTVRVVVRVEEEDLEGGIVAPSTGGGRVDSDSEALGEGEGLSQAP